MRTDFEEMLAGSLRDQAETGAPIDPAPLLYAAREDGQRIRVRRRIATAVGAAVAVIAVVLAGMALAGPAHPPPAPPVDRRSDPSAPASLDLARLPDPTGIPSAAGNPELVATDPRVLHFNVDALAADAGIAVWRSNTTYESAEVDRSDYQVYAAIARTAQVLPPPDSILRFSATKSTSTPAAVLIGGQPGTMTVSTPKPLQLPGAPSESAWHLYSIEWQPVPGVWANVQIDTKSPDQVLRLAAMVRFDRATRCALPFAVDRPPAGSRAQACEIRLGAQADRHMFTDAVLTYSDGRRSASMYGMFHDPGSGPAGTLQAGLNRVYPDPDGSFSGAIGQVWLTEVPQGTGKHYTRSQMIDMIASIRPVGDVDDPATYK